ncbi:DUF3318 domain-containing protein [Anabaenopsis arnoldii]|uniref:DUF3318 domain-containing protein n=1 Tax=Anabaenopsis arnoldii TaxID=2152938 RepID=A0ABT5AU01_9CYAN|nr:DUF3318 domain-containing protein [Anabaenopsis arnoldii]MDB9540783.1 DUF3318 domain-containing protein [Anabaenopsis arnoldii]MDH6093221.1 DUF3318 domain-containing protein [Anabaenopsis arnoldii]
MESKAEIRRLLNVIPASSRMTVKIVSKPKQPKVIDATFPLPWTRERVISINFNFWSSLPEPQRDLLILQKVSWLTQVKWFQPQIYQGVAIAGLVAGVMESAQGDVLGVGVATGLSAMALLRIWRGNKSSELDLNADLAAIAIAQRRGYSETQAAEHLLSAIEAIAGMQKNGSLDFNELIRCQNLRAIGNLSQ